MDYESRSHGHETTQAPASFPKEEPPTGTLQVTTHAPWGRAAYGGQHDGVLPWRYRCASAVGAITYVAEVVALTRTGGPDQADAPS